MKFIFASLLAGMSGALSVLGWAPYAWWPLALIGYAVLFWLLLKSKTALQAGILSLVFGFCLHLLGSGWVFGALHYKTGMALLPSLLSIVVFVFYLALFTAVPAFLWRALFNLGSQAGATLKRPSPLSFKLVVTFAALMSLGEWARSLFFNGFTSLALGYSLIDTWYSGYAPVLGVYGLSWVGFFSCGIFVLLIARYRMAVGVSLVVGMLGLGVVLTQARWTQPFGPALSYRLIQSNIAQERKFDPSNIQQQAQRLIDLIVYQAADVIVTPETAFPIFLNELPSDGLSRLQQFSQLSGSHVFIGIASIAANADGFNSVVRIAPNQNNIDQYNKVLLMPFGEYSPTGFAWFTSSLSIPLKDMSTGSIDQAPFVIGSHAIGTLICHEDLTGQSARRWLPRATLLINPSNLAWFEGSLAITQRLQIVRMRALESGRPILRVANTGITAQINSDGAVVAQLVESNEGVLSGRVQPYAGLTPYVRFGDWPIVIISSLSLFLFSLIRPR